MGHDSVMIRLMDHGNVIMTVHLGGKTQSLTGVMSYWADDGTRFDAPATAAPVSCSNAAGA